MRKIKKRWFRLDNAAKIFPPTSNRRDPRVFRFSCELYEEVNAEILSIALEKNMKLFPGFLVVLKKGFFWYYLEETNKKVKVKEETIPPCSPILESDEKEPLFRIQYYKNRINLEVHHVLTDGVGAIEFLRTLVALYVVEKEKLNIEHFELEYDASFTEKVSDSFQKYYEKPKKNRKIKHEQAYQMTGEYLKDYRLRIIEGHLYVNQVLALARKYHTTITVLITAIFMKAIELEMSISDKKKPVTIMIPINLRKHFSSVTSRNFFSICYTNYVFKKEESKLESIIEAIDKTLKKELNHEALEQTVNHLVSFEKNILIRIIPRFLKNIILKIIAKITDKDNTSVVSNIGKIDMPKGLEYYVKQVHVCASTSKKQICLCSYQNKLSIGFSSAFVSADIEKNFFRILSSLGLNVEIVTNPLEE